MARRKHLKWKILVTSLELFAFLRESVPLKTLSLKLKIFYIFFMKFSGSTRPNYDFSEIGVVTTLVPEGLEPFGLIGKLLSQSPNSDRVLKVSGLKYYKIENSSW